MMLHFAGLNCIPHIFAQVTSADRSRCNAT